MFVEISELLSDRDMIKLVLTKVNGTLSVSVLPVKIGLKDDAKDNLSPILVKGTPEELELNFIQAIQQPLSKATEMLTNMDVFEKSLEATQAKSKAASETKKKEEAEKKVYTDKMKKVEALYIEKKFAEAAILLKDISTLPVADKKHCEIMKNKINVELNAGTLFV